MEKASGVMNIALGPTCHQPGLMVVPPQPTPGSKPMVAISLVIIGIAYAALGLSVPLCT